MPIAEVNGIDIHYDYQQAKVADAETIVLINGLADDLTAWDAQVPAFVDAGFNVLRYDNRGIGNSSRPPGPYTSRLLADDLYGLLKETDTARFHLIGVSMGGMIAQTFALAYPNGVNDAGLNVLSLSLCCTYSEPTAFCSRMFELWADMASRMSVQDVMKDVILWCFTVPFFRTRGSELEEVYKAMEALDMATETYLAQLNVIQVFDTSAELKQLQSKDKVLGGVAKGKVLVFAGEEDILIPVQLSRELHGMIVGAQFRTARGGHACSLEFADDFNRSIIEFLKG